MTPEEIERKRRRHNAEWDAEMHRRHVFDEEWSRKMDELYAESDDDEADDAGELP